MICEDEGLGAVCDGMGGHDNGEVASRLAVDVLSDRASRFAARLREERPRKLSQVRAMAQDMVQDWTHAANEAIHVKGGEEAAGRDRMGTTLALALFVGDFVVVAHVGDSRVHRIRGGAIEQLTADHVIVADARREANDPRPPRKRKFVTRALGTKASVEPDVRLLDVAPGDLFLLCSDGLSDLVTPEEMVEATASGRDRRLAVRALIELANRRGGPDNITVVLAEVLADDEDLDDETDVLPIAPRSGAAPEDASDRARRPSQSTLRLPGSQERGGRPPAAGDPPGRPSGRTRP